MKLPLVPRSISLHALLDRWLSAWIARSEARWRTVELRQRYF